MYICIHQDGIWGLLNVYFNYLSLPDLWTHITELPGTTQQLHVPRQGDCAYQPIVNRPAIVEPTWTFKNQTELTAPRCSKALSFWHPKTGDFELKLGVKTVWVSWELFFSPLMWPSSRISLFDRISVCRCLPWRHRKVNRIKMDLSNGTVELMSVLCEFGEVWCVSTSKSFKGTAGGYQFFNTYPGEPWSYLRPASTCTW